uniref:Zinc finger and BTB domain-containing protein 24 n=1 Tax=Culex pipiens TaxID=7175 RepID=A0A8D8MT37_CULPI
MNPPHVYIPDGNPSSIQINLQDGPMLDHHSEAVEPPYCALCLRERPPGGQFYHYSSGPNAVEFQQTMQSVAGVELNVEDDFDICTPCWKMIQLMVDFRLCCCKAQDWIGRGQRGRGIKASDEWFYEETGLIIENLRSSIREHVLVIEGEELSGEDQMQAETISEEEEDESLVDQVDVSEGLITQISVGDFKIEVFDDVEQEAVEPTGSLVDMNRCEICNRSFASKQDLDVHMQLCKPQSEPNGGQSTAGQWQICSLCNAKLANKRTLRSHMNSVHGEKKHHCEYCGSKFARAYDLKKHCRSLHSAELANNPNTDTQDKATTPSYDPNPTTNEQDKQIFNCNICAKPFTKLYKLVRHYRIVHSTDQEGSPVAPPPPPPPRRSNNEEGSTKPTHRCFTCHKRFAKYSTLKHHVQQWHAHLLLGNAADGNL